MSKFALLRKALTKRTQSRDHLDIFTVKRKVLISEHSLGEEKTFVTTALL